MKTKNLVIILILFLLITLGSGLVVFLTEEKEQPVLNQASEKINANNQPASKAELDQTIKNEPVAEKKQTEAVKYKSAVKKAVEAKPTIQSDKIVQPEKTVSSSSPVSADQIEQVQAVLLINGVEYRTAVKLGSSVYDLMTALKEQKKIDFQGKNYSDLGFFVEQINGITNDPFGKNWVYYINGKPAQVGISNYKIKANDVIEWKYEEKSF